MYKPDASTHIVHVVQVGYSGCMSQRRTSDKKSKSFTYNEALGLAIEQQRFAEKINQEQIGKLLSLAPATISRKLHGRVPWTAEELSIVADFFSLDESALTPKKDIHGGWIPANYVPGHAKTPAEAGVSMLSHLGESNPRPIHYE